MPIYSYKNPKNGEVFDEIRNMKDYDKPFILEDGTVCDRIYFSEQNLTVIDKNREVFEVDPGYVKKCKPKYVKFRDGHREKYDPNRHC
jgi:hypothetical protein